MYSIFEVSPVVPVSRVSFGYRKIPLSRRGHVRGWHPVRPGHAQIPFESTLERDFISWVVLQPGFLAIESQPFTLWLADGRTRYTPDFRVDFEQGEKLDRAASFPRPTGWDRSSYLVEIKYEVDWVAAQCDGLEVLLSAASQVLRVPLLVVTDRDLRGDRLVRHG